MQYVVTPTTFFKYLHKCIEIYLFILDQNRKPLKTLFLIENNNIILNKYVVVTKYLITTYLIPIYMRLLSIFS